MKIAQITLVRENLLKAVIENLINLASKIQEKKAKTMDDSLCKFLVLLGQIKLFFESEERTYCYLTTDKGNILQILQDSEIPKLHAEFLKKISEARQTLDKLLYDDKQQQNFSPMLLKIYKFIYDIEYYLFQMARSVDIPVLWA